MLTSKGRSTTEKSRHARIPAHEIEFLRPSVSFIKIFFSFSLTWDPLGMKNSKWYSACKLQLNVFKLLLSHLNVSHKTAMRIFEILGF